MLRNHRRLLCSAIVGAAAAATAYTTPARADSFTAFESGQARPLAISPNGKLLFATNTPDNRIEVYRIQQNGLTHKASIPVGLEPVALAARNDHEIWVVNHLSDSISIVSVNDDGQGATTRTLLVGDEPRDVLFAGPGRDRAFITTAHRGQNVPYDPKLTTPGIGRADVWVFDADHLGSSLTGTPLTILQLFTDTPRALAASADGKTVYAAGFHTGNRTTAIHEGLVPDGGEEAGGMPGPRTNHAGIVAPEVGVIVKHKGGHWTDVRGRSWDDKVRFDLPDKDVFVIDAMANPPAQKAGNSGFYAGVGTILFNMAVNPVSGKVYVSNTEAMNDLRFEGPGTFAGSSLRGHLHESRITVLGAAGSVTPRHLNKHIDYSHCCDPAPNPENEKSLAFPQGMAIEPDGKTLYVAALGSSKVGYYKTSELEAGTFVPNASKQIKVTGGGPTGLVLDRQGKRLYVLTRFDNAISIIDTVQKREIGHVGMYNPEPQSIVRGRKIFYDASFSSAHGDSACASCHIFGDFDSLGWDLGNPDDNPLNNPNPFAGAPILPTSFHPMKGPMTTQSLRGMDNQGPMHWRGDRTGGNDAPTSQPESGSFDENAGFVKFNVAFPNLLGRSGEIPAEDMQAFADFILQVMYPPNPIRNLDNSLTPDQQAGRDFFITKPSLTVTGEGNVTCEFCHRIDPDANPMANMPGFFGTDGRTSFDFVTQHIKIPHLRNLYQKVGMFGLADLPFITSGNNGHLGDQVRGFGYTHDGTFDTVFRFISLTVFDNANPGQPEAFPAGPAGNLLRKQVEDFQLAFPTNLAPIVGQQTTLSAATNGPAVTGRVDLFIARAEAGECDLVARMRIFQQDVGLLYIGGGKFIVAKQGSTPVSDSILRLAAVASGASMTYTCAPPGSGVRIGVDRDGDGYWDGDEQEAGTNPADASSHL